MRNTLKVLVLLLEISYNLNDKLHIPLPFIGSTKDNEKTQKNEKIHHKRGGGGYKEYSRISIS